MACKWVSQPFKQPGLLSSSEVVNSTNKIAVVGVMPAQWDPVACISESWKLSRVGSCLAHRAPWSVLTATGFSPCTTREKLTFHPLRTNVTRTPSFSSSSLNSMNHCSPGDRWSDSNWGKPQYVYGFDRSLHNALDKGTTESLQLCRGSPYLLLSQRTEEQRGLGVPYMACAPWFLVAEGRSPPGYLY